MRATGPARRNLRRFVVVAALVGLLTGCFLGFGTSQQRALGLLNQDRATYRLTALPIQAEAQAKAQAWADKLARENTLYHSQLPTGIRSRWCVLGENVGYGASVDAIDAAYMASAHHRENILDPRFNGTGIGVARNGNRIFTVQEFIKTC